MKKKRQNASLPGATRSHFVAIAAILLCLASVWAFGHASIQEAQSEALAKHAQSLTELGERTQQLFSAEEEKLDVLLVRVRSDLRADGHWSDQSETAPPRDLPGSELPETDDSLSGVAESEATRPEEIAVRLGQDMVGDRWRSVRADLKRGLSARTDLQSLEIVVADQAGLTAIRVIRTEERITEEMEDPRASKGVAKAIWYADEVRRAVAANGRKVQRGAHSSTGERASDRITQRVALALHDPSELVQGVLVATIDVSAIADTLVGLAGGEIHSRIVNLEGRALQTATASAPGIDAKSSFAPQMDVDRDAILAARITAPDRTEKVFTVDGSLLDGFALINGDGRNSDAILLMEMALPPSDLISQASTAWGIGLIALTLLSALAIAFLMRRGNRRQTVLESDNDTHYAADAELDEATSPEGAEASKDHDGLEALSANEAEPALLLAREQIVLREWLGDVRGCLEREAATRGLSLNLKCERSLPLSIEQDPGWLGGLLIAMGQEALDATAEERIFVRVREDSHEVLRFEVDAGAIELSPVQGMLAIADKLGGHFESDPDGGLAFLMPLGAN